MIAIIISGLVLTCFGTSYAETSTIVKPSVPEFTLRIVARPFDFPPVATMNPYNGQITVTREGYHVANVSVDITIRNQPPYTTNYTDGINLWYEVQFRGAYQTNWQTYHAPIHNTVEYTDYIFQQIGDYTVISVPVKSDDPINFEGEHSGSITNFPEGGKIDFQVRALMGHPFVKQSGLMGDMVYFDGETGDWSSTQTVTIEENNTSTTTNSSLSPSLSPQESQNPSSTQAVPQTAVSTGNEWVQLGIVALLGVIAVLLTLTVALQLKKRKQQGIILEKEK